MVFRPYLLLVVFSACLAEAFTSSPQSSNNAAPARNAGQAAGSKATRPAGSTTKPDQNVYRNPTYGIRYSVIVGWVDRTGEMQPDEKSAGDSASAQGKVLLAVFERPPEVSNPAINAAVVIAEESAGSYPGLKSAADYVGPLTGLVTKSGFKVVGEPSEITIGSRMLVECNFVREDGKMPAYQTTLILLQKGTLVSFTFIGGSAGEVDGLMDRLTFQAPVAARPK